MRKKIIAGNWKMNKNHTESGTLAQSIVEKVSGIRGVDVVLCPPFTSLSPVGEAIKGSTVALGAQNMHWEKEGAYTGEISANMLLTLGCQFVILGHSERRAYFHESDEIVAKKVNAAIQAGLTPIVCVGETREEREKEITKEVVKRQVTGAFRELTADEFEGTVIAYEPVWAIGTGLTATSEQAQEVHEFIRRHIAGMFGSDLAESTRIQYGGSMKPGNARELLAQADIDGGLIGGAALDAGSFEGIIRAAL
ncbi:MAG: triose-phosphate isomerase [Candidatus Latescibacteria bacterium]|nr:triose-phosphate isomerase [Candidatus Latescibacterota bacterium]